MKRWTIIFVFGLILGVSLTTAFFHKESLMAKMQPAREYQNATPVETPYNVDAEVAQAFEQLKKSSEKAGVVRGIKSSSRCVVLTFDGLTDRITLQKVLGLLQKYNAKATFFADGLQTAEDPELLADIMKAGQKIENYTLVGMPKMEQLPVDRLIIDFCRAKKIIKEEAAQETILLKCNETKYTDQVLQAAKVCGFRSVVQSDAFLNVKQINTPAAADAFVAALQPGNIVSIKLKTNIDFITPEQGKTDAKPAIDKQPSLKEASQPLGLEEKEIIVAVEQLLIALQKAKYSTVFVLDFPNSNAKADLESNRSNKLACLSKSVSILKEQLISLFSCRTAYAAEKDQQAATEIKMIFTTEQAVSYTFGGIAKEAVVDDVLTKLNKLGFKGTFFVSEIEMKKYPQTLRKIIANGHEIGIAIRPKDGAGFDETRNSIIRSSRILKGQFGVSTNLVKQVSGVITDTTKQAVGSLECKLIGQSINVVQAKHKDYTSVDAIMAEVFRESMVSLARGQILYFRMDFYTTDRIIGQLMESIKHSKIDNIAYATFYDNSGNNRANNSQYTIKPVGKILNNAKLIYKYPVDIENVPAHLRAEWPETATASHDFLTELSKHYIGQQYVNVEERMIGFSKMEDRRLDKSGCIQTKDKVIFLTFDDWGSDAAINKLLYVLRKHHVPGTFFVITNNVLNNPNLLRTIAQEGHEIGSHSDKHKPMAVLDPTTKKYIKTQDKDEYVQDLALSFRKLRDITGDVTVNGKPALTRYFRPPTLALSKMGVEALFETGFDYIISGSLSTNDYEASSVAELIERMKGGIFTEDGEVQKGAIMVMHMSDNAKYTATALDILLTANEAKKDSDPSKFKVGRLSDYLIDGYSQINRKKTLRLVHSSEHDNK